MSPTKLRVTDVGKPQIVRLVDIFVIGPLLIWAGGQEKPLPVGVKNLLITLGIVTVIYNLKNFYEVRELSRDTYKRTGPKIFTTGDV